MRILLFLLFSAACAVISEAAVTYSYDAAGRLATVDYGNGATIAYTYDPAGNVLSKTVTAAPGAASRKAPAVKKEDKNKAPEELAAETFRATFDRGGPSNLPAYPRPQPYADLSAVVQGHRHRAGCPLSGYSLYPHLRRDLPS